MAFWGLVAKVGYGGNLHYPDDLLYSVIAKVMEEIGKLKEKSSR